MTQEDLEKTFGYRDYTPTHSNGRKEPDDITNSLEFKILDTSANIMLSFLNSSVGRGAVPGGIVILLGDKPIENYLAYGLGMVGFTTVFGTLLEYGTIRLWDLYKERKSKADLKESSKHMFKFGAGWTLGCLLVDFFKYRF